MRALIRKEWLENKWLIIGFLVIAPLLSLGLKWGIVGWDRTLPEQSIQIFIPILTLLYVLAIAADLIAADASSGRIGLLFSLPLRPSKVWAAKAVFLFAGAACFVFYLLVVEVVMLSLGGKVAADLFTPNSGRWWFFLVPSVVVGAATMATSALVDRGLAAAILALLIVAGLGWAASNLQGWGMNVKPDGSMFYIMTALSTAAFIAASLTATTLGRIHLSARFRRVVLAGAAFLVVIVPPTAWAGARVHRWLHIEPHQQDIKITKVLTVDPAGTWALVESTRPDRKFWDISKHTPYATWAVNLESGTVRDLTEFGHPYPAGIPWFVRNPWSAEPGCIVLYRWQPNPGQKASTCLRVVYDLERGEVVTTRPLAPDVPQPRRTVRRGPLLTESIRDPELKAWKCRVRREDREPLELPDGCTPLETAREWGLLVCKWGKNSRPEYHIFMTDTGELRPIAASPSLLPSTPEGYGWVVRTLYSTGSPDCRINRIPLDGSPAETIIEGKGKGGAARKNTGAFAYIDSRAWWVDADRDKPLELQGVRFNSPDLRIHWSVNGRVCVATDGTNAWRMTATEDGPSVESIPPPYLNESWPEQCFPWFDGEKWLALESNGRHLYVLELDGSTKQLLPIPEESR